MIKRLKLERLIFLICLLICLLILIISGLQVKAMQAEIEELQYQNSRQAAQLKDKDYQIEILEIILENRELDASEPMATEPEYLGTFTVTHYCPCEICCGKTDGITFTGTQATEGRTIAVDPDVIPLGSKVIIDGNEYTAEDVGGAIKNNKLDIFILDHQRALNLGVVEKEVYLIE